MSKTTTERRRSGFGSSLFPIDVTSSVGDPSMVAGPIPPPVGARRRGPGARTSRAAAARVTRRASCELNDLLTLVHARPGSTATELHAIAADRFDRYDISRRLPVLRARGLVRNGATRRCQVKGTEMLTWFPTSGASA